LLWRHERIDQDPGILEPIAGHLDPDPRMAGRPVEDSGQHLLHARKHTRAARAPRKDNGFPNPASPPRLGRLSAVVLAGALAGTAIGLTHGRAWGEDRFGQLGNGESGPGAISSVPVEVSELFSYLPPPSGEAGDVRF